MKRARPQPADREPSFADHAVDFLRQADKHYAVAGLRKSAAIASVGKALSWKIAQAHRFTCDDTFTKLAADIIDDLDLGDFRKIIQSARLPFHTVWVEGTKVTTKDKIEVRYGALCYNHPNSDRVTIELLMGGPADDDAGGRALPAPLSFTYDYNLGPLNLGHDPNTGEIGRLQDQPEGEDLGAILFAQNFGGEVAIRDPSFAEVRRSIAMRQSMFDLAIGKNYDLWDEREAQGAIILTSVFALIMVSLAMINDTPVSMTRRVRSGQRLVKGKLRPYLSQSVVTIEVPKKVSIGDWFMQQIAKNTASKRGWHPVRGHWVYYKSDRPCRTKNEHDFVALDPKRQECKKCLTTRTWRVLEHGRGDPTLQIKTHRYHVTKGQGDPRKER